jgi:hypothetical protein
MLFAQCSYYTLEHTTETKGTNLKNIFSFTGSDLVKCSQRKL